MIVAEQKPLDDLKRMTKGKKKVLAVGCGTCVSVCFSGGKKETGALASALQTAAAIDGETLEVEERTVQRQCVQEFIEPLAEDLEEYDAIGFDADHCMLKLDIHDLTLTLVLSQLGDL